MRKIFNLILALSTILASPVVTGEKENISSKAPKTEEIKVWGTPLSPYVRKVISVLEFKNLSYNLIPALPSVILKANKQEIPQDFLKASPLGKIPALEVGDFSIADSSVIVAFLEKKYTKSPSVYPKCPVALARALWFEKYSDETMTKVIHPIFLERVVKPIAFKAPSDEGIVAHQMEQVPSILHYLETTLAARKGKYLVGNDMTIGDIAVVHQMYDLQLAKVQWSEDLYPHLASYLKEVMAQPCIQKAIQKM